MSRRETDPDLVRDTTDERFKGAESETDGDHLRGMVLEDPNEDEFEEVPEDGVVRSYLIQEYLGG